MYRRELEGEYPDTQSISWAIERSRAIFTVIDEGILIGELLADPDGRPEDVLFLEINPAGERILGRGYRGCRMSEMILLQSNTNGQQDGSLFKSWMDAITKVIRKGELLRMENYFTINEKWINLHLSKIFPGETNRFIMVFHDITERRRRETNQAFLTAFSLDIASVSTPAQLVNAFGERLSRFIQASRCAFVQINENFREAIIQHEWRAPASPSLVGRYDLPQFVTDEFRETMKRGIPTVVRDASKDSRIRDKDKFAALGIGSFINVPLIRNNKWEFALGLYHDCPYNWRDDEISLMIEAAKRIWHKLRAMQTVNALHDAERRLEIVLETTNAGTFKWFLNEEHGEADERMLQLLGIGKSGEVSSAMALSQAIHPEDKNSLMESAMRMLTLTEKEKLIHRIRVIHSDTSVHTLLITAQVFFNHERMLHYLHGVAIEVV